MISTDGKQTFHNVINGELTNTAETRHTLNPATCEPNPEVPLSTRQDLDHAVEAARKAQKSWAKTTFEERRNRLHAYADTLETYRNEFVDLVISEQGKSYGLAQDEFTRTLRAIRVTSNLELSEEVVEDSEERTAVVRYIPIGVTCALVPWNYPLLLAWVKMAAALYSGNALIVKPSPDTPYCGLKIVELGINFFPPGILQALSGGHDLGPLCTAHPGIDKISFTGSIATGRLVMESCAKTLKRVTLELGGNDAAIICEDVNIDKTVPSVRTKYSPNTISHCFLFSQFYITHFSPLSKNLDRPTLLHQLGPSLYGHQTRLRPHFNLPPLPLRPGILLSNPQNRPWHLPRHIHGPRPKRYTVRKGTILYVRHRQRRSKTRPRRPRRKLHLRRRYGQRERKRLLHHPHHHRQPPGHIPHRPRRTLRPHRPRDAVVR